MKKFQSSSFSRSAMYALNGLRLAFKSQRNFRKHLYIAFTIIVIALFLKLGILEICMLILVNSIVLICELFNSVIEFVIDAYYKNKWAKLAKISKDIGAGMVLLSAVTAMTIAVILFGARIYRMIS